MSDKNYPLTGDALEFVRKIDQRLLNGDKSISEDDLEKALEAARGHARAIAPTADRTDRIIWHDRQKRAFDALLELWEREGRKYKPFSERIGHYQIDTDADGNQTITDLKNGGTWGGMHISSRNNAGDAVDGLLEEEAMRAEEAEKHGQ